jgi:hypothetical protein
MLKLLICIFVGAALGLGLLTRRQQRLNLMSQTARLHSQLQATQAKLWSQQLQIAAKTGPREIEKLAGDDGLTPGILLRK